MDGSVKIIHPLGQPILDLVHATQEYEKSLGYVSEETTVKLNSVIRSGEILLQLHHTFVIGIGPSHVVKITLSLDYDHIDNTQYLTTYVPKLPIPHCLGTLCSGRRTYLFMSRAPGSTLESIWSELSTKQKISVQEQLNRIFQHLRAQSSVNSESHLCLGSFVSGVCKDVRSVQRVSSGKIRTEADFNDFLIHDPNKTVTPWVKMIRSFMKDDHRIVMTHGDLHPRNIMVTLEANESHTVHGDMLKTSEKDILVSSIIDWETAGWYPESWEYVKALNNIDVRGPLRDWVDFLPTDAIGSFPMEFSVDHLLDAWLG